MRRVLLVITTVSVLGLTACGNWNDDRGWGDAPADQQSDKPIKVWPAPDGFMNVGAFCIGEDGVYVHTREAQPVVVPSDPNCDPGGFLSDVEPKPGEVDTEFQENNNDEDDGG